MTEEQAAPHLALVVDGDPEARELFRVLAQEAGCDAVAAETLGDAERSAATRSFELLLVGVRRSGPGPEELGAASQKIVGPCIVVLPQIERASSWYEAGATYLLRRSEEPAVFVATIRAALKRQSDVLPSVATERVEIGGVIFDRRRHTLEYHGRNVHLTPKEWIALEQLGLNVGNYVTTETLRGEALGTSASAGQLRSTVTRLRHKLLEGRIPLSIGTKRGSGYGLLIGFAFDNRRPGLTLLIDPQIDLAEDATGRGD